MSSEPTFSTEILVIGAGPAGIAAAVSAAECGRRVLLIDDNPRPGGQIWRGANSDQGSATARRWLQRLERSAARRVNGCRAVFLPEPNLLIADLRGQRCAIRFEQVILASGARELYLPFPGWTLPGVTGAGGLQALIKAGLEVSGKHIVIAGSGPLLLAVAATARQAGARVLCIAEQASAQARRDFAFGLWRHPGKLAQAARLRWQSVGAPYYSDAWITHAEGENQLTAVWLKHGTQQRRIECDLLACGFGLVPNLDLAQMFGCVITHGAIGVDASQRCSQSNVYAAGESTGIGGVDKALLEGRIAGLAAAGFADKAAELFAARARTYAFAKSLAKTFALRDELRYLATPETFFCRCEDVPLAAVRDMPSMRQAKLSSRWGMGACQGRICGSAGEFLFGWSDTLSTRPPFTATALSNLIPSPLEVNQQ
ncbi:NAD(P)/FAD-dependent oxidoreductase [Pseudolysobacter antarcticus]|uniref:NAD(P)/FAD-dependent oxidoreductase n=1 Tax=Pseudolysobacter antarcticus TaxID=2511995 RepID=A0A411HHG4_9GAMM|nr:FAD/NAD(P)-binding oxidoreductase [Pseudolysobacter antarcticus]QBB69840.1 NAD(P)/FAD-dependent oxidoreductase [Pseudolysobacter antarcticus]